MSHVRSLGFGQTDWATPAQRERDRFLITQIAAIAEAIRQAQARGDDAAVKAMQATKDKLFAEHMAIQRAIVAQGGTGTAAAEARPYGAFQGLYDTLTKAGKYAAIGLAAVLLLPPLLRRRGK